MIGEPEYTSKICRPSPCRNCGKAENPANDIMDSRQHLFNQTLASLELSAAIRYDQQTAGSKCNERDRIDEWMNYHNNNK